MNTETVKIKLVGKNSSSYGNLQARADKQLKKEYRYYKAESHGRKYEETKKINDRDSLFVFEYLLKHRN